MGKKKGKDRDKERRGREVENIFLIFIEQVWSGEPEALSTISE